MASDSGPGATPWWAWCMPLAACLVVLVGAMIPLGTSAAIVCALVLVPTVFAAVFHAEVVAHRIGEPYGTLVLAVAVTVIEVALIISVMIGAPAEKAELARDTVFAAVMIVCNGIVGLSLLMGGMRHHVQGFQVESASAALAVLAALTVLTLVMPNLTISTDGPNFSATQLVFAAIFSLVLYGAFVFAQTVRHRDYFLPPGTSAEHEHAAPPPASQAMASFGLLLLALVAVIGLAKLLTPSLETVIGKVNAPKAFVGVVIAGLVLLPEGLAALRAARANRLQTSLNLALGSALASIGLTIPAVTVVTLWMNMPLQLGLGGKEMVLLALTLLLGVITLGTGRTTFLQGVVHLVTFAAFVLFALVP